MIDSRAQAVAPIVQALRARAAGEAVAPPIPLDEILEVSRVTIEVAQGLEG